MRYRVNKIRDHNFQDGEYKLLIEWKGFDEEEATWEPFHLIFEDVPDMVRQYVTNINANDKMLDSLRIMMIQ